MKVQCDVCEKAAATLVCCADEAALCAECDTQVHAANKLAGKHERLPFLSHQPSPCDICQEKMGHFFCVEDRSLLCRDCDVSIHTVNKLVEKHKRFLVMGLRVGLEAMAVPQPRPAPSAPPPPLGVCRSSNANVTVAAVDTVQPPSRMNGANPHEAMWQVTPAPKANVMQSIHATIQALKPLVTPPTLSPHVHTATSPPASKVYLPNRSLQPDELLDMNATKTFIDTPSQISIPSLGWDLPNVNSLASWDLAAIASGPYLFEESLAEVPSTPSVSIESQASLKRKRSIDSYDGLAYSTFQDQPHLQVPSKYVFPSLKEGNISFYRGGK